MRTRKHYAPGKMMDYCPGCCPYNEAEVLLVKQGRKTESWLGRACFTATGSTAPWIEEDPMWECNNCGHCLPRRVPMTKKRKARIEAQKYIKQIMEGKFEE